MLGVLRLLFKENGLELTGWFNDNLKLKKRCLYNYNSSNFFYKSLHNNINKIHICLSVKTPEPATNEFDMILIWLLLGTYDGLVVVE